MMDLSEEAIAIIDRVIADKKNLYSQSIDLYQYRYLNNRTVFSNDLVLNETYHFLNDNYFVSSNNPTSEMSKFLVTYSPNW